MSPIRVGILGGGQLSRMIVEAAKKVDLVALPLVQSAKDPAAQVTKDFICGAIDDVQSLRKLFEKSDLIIFENEFVNIDQLRKASTSFPKIKFVPSLEVIESAQNKISQKEIFKKLEIPSAKYKVYEPGSGKLEYWIADLLGDFPEGCLIKWAVGGYDGKGNFVYTHEDQINEALPFCMKAVSRSVPLFAEEKIDFDRELAVVATYSTDNTFVAYPLVISEQEKNICRWIHGPATAFGINPELEIEAHRIAKRIAERLPLYGSFGIEFFETKAGDLMTNELAPRVHNSGHYSLNAAEVSQFENHLRAVTGMPLRNARTASAFSMLNVLGPDHFNLEFPSSESPFNSSQNSIFPYWYGKSETRAWRKLGHINAQANSVKELLPLQEEMRQLEKAWLQGLKA